MNEKLAASAIKPPSRHSKSVPAGIDSRRARRSTSSDEAPMPSRPARKPNVTSRVRLFDCQRARPLPPHGRRGPGIHNRRNHASLPAFAAASMQVNRFFRRPAPRFASPHTAAGGGATRRCETRAADGKAVSPNPCRPRGAPGRTRLAVPRAVSPQELASDFALLA
jgi:hypothetical protein